METTLYYDANGRIKRVRSYLPDPPGVAADEVAYLVAEAPGTAADYYVQLSPAPTLVKRAALAAEFSSRSVPAGASCSIELPPDDTFNVMTSCNGVIERRQTAGGNLTLSSAAPGRMQVTVDGVKYQKRLYFLEFT